MRVRMIVEAVMVTIGLVACEVMSSFSNVEADTSNSVPFHILAAVVVVLRNCWFGYADVVGQVPKIH